METVLSVLLWCITLGALLLLPALLYFVFRRRRYLAAVTAVVCAAVLFTGAAWVAHHPIRSCPENLEPYMTEERWQDILSVTPPIFNAHLPFFPWRVAVERADESELYWRTDWFPTGTTRTGVTPDGYDPVYGLR